MEQPPARLLFALGPLRDIFLYIKCRLLSITIYFSGGIGTTIFSVSGPILVLGAGAILIACRKADAE